MGKTELFVLLPSTSNTRFLFGEVPLPFGAEVFQCDTSWVFHLIVIDQALRIYIFSIAALRPS